MSSSTTSSPATGRTSSRSTSALVVGDVRDPGAVAEAMAGADVVFHLAASVGNKRSIEHPVDDSEINVLGTLRVLEAARELGVRKVVFSSSAGIFGELKELPIREDHPVEPGLALRSQQACRRRSCASPTRSSTRLEAICLRYFNVYGPNQRYDAYGNVIPIFAHRLVNGDTLTSTTTASRRATSSTFATSRGRTCSQPARRASPERSTSRPRRR